MVKYRSKDLLLDLTFSALADPTRRAILRRLSDSDSSVNSLAKPFDMSLPAVSKHLRVLERAGLLVQNKQGRVRRCRLESAPLRAAAKWIAFYQQFWSHQLDGLADFLESNDDSADRNSAPKNPE